jgi:hypothetical protein
MRQRWRCLFPLLLLFMLSHWHRVARAAALEPGCVTVHLDDSPPVPNVRPRLDVTLTNGCGKEVTSFTIRLRPANEDPHLGGRGTVHELLAALVIPAEERSYDILLSGQSATFKMPPPVVGLTASSLSASITCLLFLDRTAVGDKQAIREALDIRRKAGVGEYELGQQILAKTSDFDAATVYFRGTPAAGTLEEKFVIKFSRAFRHMSREDWSNYVAEQRAMNERLIALFKELPAQCRKPLKHRRFPCCLWTVRNAYSSSE